LLEEAEDIVDSAVPEALHEVEDEEKPQRHGRSATRRRWPWTRRS
jgi:hypothetical protein